jgi:DNA-binding NarL/FixJ family response regulator
MEMAQAGRVYIDPEVTNQNRLARRFWETLSAAERPHVQHGAARISLLTPREQNVAQRIAASHTVNGIANALDLAPKTVENYTARVYRKLDLKGIESKGLRPSVLLAKIYLWHKLKGGEREKS